MKADPVIVIKGAGEMATGVATCLHGAGFRKIVMLEIEKPLAVRRSVSFCEAVHDGCATVEGVTAVRAGDEGAVHTAWERGVIPVVVDPEGRFVRRIAPDVLVDATLAKRNTGISATDAPLVVALGPGFEAGRDCHAVIETQRGHHLGRIIRAGTASADTGVPEAVAGYASERVVRAPVDGQFTGAVTIGAIVRKGERIGIIGSTPVLASIGGVVRGLIRTDTFVVKGLKIGDIDPRGDVLFCSTISDKARMLGGAVLVAICGKYEVCQRQV